MAENINGYRVAGTTDDVTTCEQCGREGLRSTVRLVVIADGCEDGELYVGSECATRFPAPGGRKRTAYQVRNQAAAADREADGWRNVARDMLAFYDAPELTLKEKARRYLGHNVHTAGPEVARRREMDPTFTTRDLITERIAEWRKMLVTGEPPRR